MLRKLLYLSFCFIALAQKQLRFSQGWSYDSTAQGGSQNINRKNNTIGNFIVYQYDEKLNKTFPCLKVQFTLKTSLSNVTPNTNQTDTLPLSFNQTMTEKTKINEEYSNCQHLILDWEPDTKHPETENPAQLSLQFQIDTSTKDDFDTKIFYLEYIKADNFLYQDHRAEASLEFQKEQALTPPPNEESDKDTTPVEANFLQSFKCYFGFSVNGNNTAVKNEESEGNMKDQILEFEFKKFRMEMYTQYSDEIADGTKWRPVYSCDNDISKTLPIIVGCVLALIVIGTIGGYIVAKRRSSYAYQEI